MPSTLSGLALLAALLVPGFVYLERLESRQPAHEYTTLRETGQVLLSSLVSNSIVLILFAVVRAMMPHGTPDVGAWVRGGNVYLRHHYWELFAWGGAGLALSSGLAALLAVPPAWFARLVERVVKDPDAGIRRGVTQRRQPPIVHQSGWATVFHLDPERVPFVGVTLRDRTYIAGPLLSFSSQIEENGDRSLVLSSPVEIRHPGQEASQPFFGDTVVIGVGEISFMTVSYLREAPRSTPFTGIDCA